MAIGGVGQFPVRGDENDPRRGRRKPIDRDELIREILDEKQVVSNVNLNPTPISDKAFAALEEEEYLRSLRPEDQIETGKKTRRQRRSDELKGLRALMAGNVNEVKLVDTNMLSGKFSDGTVEQGSKDISPRFKKVLGAAEIKAIAKKAGVSENEIIKRIASGDIGDRPSIIRRSDSRVFPRRVRSTVDPNRTIQDPRTRGEEILRPRDGGSYDTILGSIQSPRSYGIGRMTGKLQDEKAETYIDVARAPGNLEIQDPFEEIEQKKKQSSDSAAPFTPVQRRSRQTSYIPKESQLLSSDKELEKVFKSLTSIDPTARMQGSSADRGPRMGKIAAQILKEAKTLLIDRNNPDIRFYTEEEKRDYIENNPIKDKAYQNIVGEVTKKTFVKVRGQGTREVTTTQPVFDWKGADDLNKFRIGNPRNRDNEYLRSQIYRLDPSLVPTTVKEPIKSKQQTISMADIRRVQSRGYTFKRLDDRGASAEMIRPDGTKTLLNLLPDGSGYRISDAYRTFDRGITQVINQPTDTWARWMAEKVGMANTEDFYAAIAAGGFMEEPSDQSRRALNTLADAVITGKITKKVRFQDVDENGQPVLRTEYVDADIDPNEILKRLRPGSAALQDLESAIRAKTATAREVEFTGEAAITNKNRAARELYENLIDYKTKMGAAMPVDLGTELIVTLGKKYNLDPTDVATSIRELPIEDLRADNEEATKMETERRTQKRSSAQANEMTIRDPDKTIKQTNERLPQDIQVSQARQIIPEGSNAEKYFIEKGYRRNLGTALESGDAAVTRIRDAYQINQESSNIPQSSSINTAQASQVNAPESPVTPTTYKQMSEGLGSDVGSAEHDKAMNELMQRLLRNRRR